jgi:hypothetical protein
VLLAGTAAALLFISMTSCAGAAATAVITVPTTVAAIVPQAVTVVLEVTETAAPPERTIQVSVTATPPAPAAAFRDGQHIVGRDIQPGTYRASAVSGICYWERKDQAGDVIANAFGTVATIRSGDYTFQSNRCGTWSRVD